MADVGGRAGASNRASGSSAAVRPALAMLVGERFAGVGLFRRAPCAPNVVSLVIVGLVWKFLLTDQAGSVPRPRYCSSTLLLFALFQRRIIESIKTSGVT